MKENRIVIYKITNTVTGRFFIGQSKFPFESWAKHCIAETELGKDIRNIGLDKFKFEILEEVDEQSFATRRESAYLLNCTSKDTYNFYPKGFKLSSLSDEEFETFILTVFGKTFGQFKAGMSFYRESTIQIQERLEYNYGIKEKYLVVRKRLLELGIVEGCVRNGQRILKFKKNSLEEI